MKAVPIFLMALKEEAYLLQPASAANDDPACFAELLAHLKRGEIR
jgi:hypothetical protein